MKNYLIRKQNSYTLTSRSCSYLISPMPPLLQYSQYATPQA